MIQFNRPSTPSPLTFSSLLLITLLPLYLLSHHYRTQHPYGGGSPPTPQPPKGTPSLPSSLSPSSESFIPHWLSTDLIHPFDPAPLASYCNHTYSTAPATPHLVLQLFDANGGIGNVRGNVLDFVFSALELGGAGIYLPGMAARDAKDLSNVWGNGGRKEEFGGFFDQEWFVGVLGMVCPRLEVYKIEEGEEVEMVEAVSGVWRAGSRRVDEDFGNTAGRNREGMRGWLEENEDWKGRYGGGGGGGGGKEGKGEGEGEVPVVVNVERTLWDVDTRSLPRGMRRNFGQLVKVAPKYRTLAALVTWRLVERFGLKVDPQDVVPKGAFYGAHLRTADDAKNAGWLDQVGMNATAQMDEYIMHAKEHDLSVIYVASGNMEDVKRFQAKAAAQTPPIVVTGKFDLLPEHESAIVEAMSWDQQALIDWEVLKRCSVFGGIVKSSFAFNIAMTRFQYLEDRNTVVDPWSVQHSETNLAFDDGFSRIFGRDDFHEKRIPRGMWP